MRPDPPEKPGGQDDQPPDLGLALAVVIHLLVDLRQRLALAEPVPEEDADLVLRILAISAVLRRIRDRMEK
jgi:hypothetical protein